MPAPEIQTPDEFQYYVQQHGIRKNWAQPTHPEMVESLNKLHRFTRQLVTEKDRMQETLGWNRIWIRILGGCVIAEFAIIGWFAIVFLERI